MTELFYEKLSGIADTTNGRYSQNTFAKRLDIVSGYSDSQICVMVINSDSMKWKKHPAFYSALYQIAKNGISQGSFRFDLSNDKNEQKHTASAGKSKSKDPRGERVNMSEKKDVHCSFCGKNPKEVKKIITGPSGNICNECVKICAEIIEVETPTTEEEYLELATKAWEKKQYGEALKLIQEGLNLDTTDIRLKASLLNRRGTVYLYMDDFDKAYEDFNESIKVDPSFPASYHNLGLLYSMEDKFQESEREYRKAIKLDPDFVLSYNGLGMIYKKQQKYKQSEEMFNEAIRINPKVTMLILNLADLYEKQQEFHKAKLMYKKYLQLCPDDQYIEERLTDIILKQQKSDIDIERQELNSAKPEPDISEKLTRLKSMYEQELILKEKVY